ncbi:MAG TPA: hypothetical protein VMX35_03705 [Acidobacteriota bacterium]|nr:hypothetical protein [Acidobacteriota bacterium]
MWKWVLVGVGVIVALAVLGFMLLATADPQGMADFFLALDDDIEITLGGKSIEVEISRFEEGLGPADRAFAVKKMLVLLARKLEDEENTQYMEEYNRALVEVAEDRLLTAEENRRLREMFSDFVTEEDVSNWMEEFRKLEEEGKIEDPDEIWQ